MEAPVVDELSILLERVMGIEPTYSAWEADVLPLNYTRAAADFTENRGQSPISVAV
jgi:hypothetical protein